MKTVSRRPIAGAATLALLAAMAVAVIPAVAQEGPPECPAAPADAIVVALPFEELYANRGDAAAIGSTVAAAIPAGNYDIRLTGWDDHVIGDVVKETQQREVYQVQGFSGGSTVFSSGETPDLPDEQNTITAVVNTNAAVPALDSVRAIHGEPSADETANSIHPICLVLVPVQQETTTTTVPETTTTTVAETTTTTVPETTTTTVDVTTTSTTAPPQTTTTVGPGASTTTTVVVAPTSTTPDTLPFTGVESDQLAIVAFLALAAGSGLLLTTRGNAEARGNRVP